MQQQVNSSDDNQLNESVVDGNEKPPWILTSIVKP